MVKHKTGGLTAMLKRATDLEVIYLLAVQRQLVHLGLLEHECRELGNVLLIGPTELHHHGLPAKVLSTWATQHNATERNT